MPLTDANKMDLMNMSQNNKWWLFYNRQIQQLFMYELVVSTNPNQKEMQFRLKYGLDFDKTHMFQHMYVLGVDPIEFFKENLSQVKISNTGQVNLCYIENLPFIDIEGQSSNSNSEGKEMVQCRVVGVLFQVPGAGKFYMKNASFQHVFDFPKEAQKNLSNLNERRKSALDRQINSIRMCQARLPR